MDNLSSHKGPGVRELIEAAGAELHYLPPYSPDFNPIENAFANLKALFRKAATKQEKRLARQASRNTKIRPQITQNTELSLNSSVFQRTARPHYA